MADYVLKKIPELDVATSIVDADKFVIETATGTKQIDFANLKASIPNYGYLSNVFTSLALSGNILTINHAKNTRKIRLTIFNPAGISNPYPWYIVDANNVAINFGGTIEGGDWEYLLEFWTSEGTGSYPDPIYELAIKKESIVLMQNPGPGITIVSNELKRYNDLIIGYIALNINNDYTVNSWVNVGQLNIAGASADRLFQGSFSQTNVYESASLAIQTIGTLQVRAGYKPLSTCYFNVSFFTVEP